MLSKEEIEEGNILIAEFHGKYGNIFKFSSKEDLIKCKFDYHKSWDWLMPIVEKIAKQLPREEEMNNYTQCSIKINAWINSGYPYNLMTNCRIGDFYIDDKSSFYISKGGGGDKKDGSLINSVWLAVVEYIKYYNKIKTK